MLFFFIMNEYPNTNQNLLYLIKITNEFYIYSQ